MFRNCFRKAKVVKGEKLAVLEEEVNALDSNKKGIFRFFGYRQASKIDVKRIMETAKKEIRRRMNHLTGLTLNDKNLMKTIIVE